MSLTDGLLVQTAAITHRARTGAPDRYNRPDFEESSSSVSCYVEQIRRREDIVGREAQIGDWLAIFPPGTAVDGSDQVVVGGITFEVVGPAWSVTDPFDGGVVDHVEATLREVTG